MDNPPHELRSCGAACMGCAQRSMRYTPRDMTDTSHTTDNAADNTTAPTLYQNLVVEKKERSEVEITGEIPHETALAFESKTLAEKAKRANLPGFREGKVPPSVLKERMGATELLKEIAEDVLAEAYPLIVTDESLDVIGRPAVALTTLVPGSPVGFKIRTAVMPEVTLPDWQKIAAAERTKKTDPKKLEVQDSEIDDVLKRVRESEAHAKYRREHPDTETSPPPEIPESEWPELTDEMAQKLGDFKGVADLKDSLRKNIAQEKEQKAKEEKRIALIDALLAKTTADVPLIFIESELDQMLHEFSARVGRAGFTWEGYLAQAGKTEESIRTELEPEAEKRAKIQLLLNELAKMMEITPDADKVAREVAHLKEHYPEADEARAKAYVESMLANQMVFEKLEGGE